MTATSDFKVGDRIVVMGKHRAVIRFIGETAFAQGEWFGVELDEEQGKNDGCVQGVEYFKCSNLKGMFVRRSSVAHETEGSGGRASPKGATGKQAKKQSQAWARRTSADSGLDQAIHINSQAEMLEAVRCCSAEVEKLHAVVQRLSSALDDASTREAACASHDVASAALGVAGDGGNAGRPEHVPNLERWLTEAAERLGRRMEERLGTALEEEVAAAIANPIAQLRGAAQEIQRLSDNGDGGTGNDS